MGEEKKVETIQGDFFLLCCENNRQHFAGLSQGYTK